MSCSINLEATYFCSLCFACEMENREISCFHKRYLIKSMTFRWSMLYCDLVMITVASSQPNASICSPIPPKENIYYAIPMSIDRDGQGKCHFLFGRSSQSWPRRPKQSVSTHRVGHPTSVSSCWGTRSGRLGRTLHQVSEGVTLKRLGKGNRT